MYTQDCQLSELLPPHAAHDAAKRSALASSMEEGGWQGRPLLGWWDEASGCVYLLTGSHRYAAAKAAGLDEVPVALVEVAEGLIEARGEDLYVDGVRLADYADMLPVLRNEDPDAAELLALN